MSRIDELIARLCPDGAPRRTLGEIGQFQRGRRFTKADVVEDGIPSIHYGEIYTHYGVAAAETVSHVRADLATQLRFASPGDVVIAGVGETVEDVGKAVAWLGAADAAIHDDCFRYHHSMDPKYVSYYLQTEAFHSQKRRHVARAKVKRLSAEALASIVIPVPPLEVQREIVRVLDTFAALEAELEAELAARRRQYAHYRDSLLTFPEGGVRRVPMGEVASIVRGASPRPIQAFLAHDERGVPWIKIGDIAASGKYITGTAERVTADGASKSRRVHPGDFVLSNSMSFGRPYIVGIEGCIHDGWLAISDFNASFVPDFLYHLLRSAPVQAEFARRAGGGTVQNLNADIVKAVVLPIPHLEEQARIVAILDAFDALVNDLSSGLPAELAARRKQYEYYRDRLLTFKEAAA